MVLNLVNLNNMKRLLIILLIILPFCSFSQQFLRGYQYVLNSDKIYAFDYTRSLKKLVINSLLFTTFTTLQIKSTYM